MRARIYLLSLIWLALWLSGISGREPAAKAKPARSDLHGDPLPQGAVVRLGTGRCHHPEVVRALAFSPDGKTLAVASHHLVVLMDRATGKLLRRHRLEPFEVRALTFTPEGKLLALGGADETQRVNATDFRAYLAEVETGKTLCTFEGGTQNVRWGGFSLGGKLTVSGNEEVCVWDRTTGKQVQRWGPPLTRRTLAALSPAGDLAAVISDSSDRLIRLREVKTGNEVRRLSCTTRGNLECLAFSPDGRILACGRYEFHIGNKTTANGTVELLDTTTGKHLRLLDRGPSLVTALAFSPDGKVLAGGRLDGVVCLWEVTGGKLLHPTDGPRHGLLSARFTPDGSAVMGVDTGATAWFWDAATARPLREHALGPPAAGCVPVFSPDGKQLAAVGSEKTIRLLDLATGKELHRLGKPGNGLWRLAFSNDGRALAGAAWDGNIEQTGSLVVWDTRTGRQRFELELPWMVTALAFSPDHRALAIGSVGGGARLLDATTGEVLRTIQKDPPERDSFPSGFPLDLRFSPDGKCLAGGFLGTPLALWELHSGKEIEGLVTPPSEQQFYVRAVAFSPDCRFFALSDVAHGIRLWDLTIGKQRVRFEGHTGEIWSLAFSPDGKRLVSASADNTALVWEVPAAALPEGKLPPAAVATLWADLAAADATRAHRAVCKLLAAPDQSIPLLSERMKPVPRTAPAEKVKRLVMDLDSERFAVRQRASAELETMGELAEPALRKVLHNSPSLEVRRRAEKILAKLQTQRLRELRAVRVLEMAATPHARRLLRELSRGLPGAPLTEDARAALDRLDRRP